MSFREEPLAVRFYTIAVAVAALIFLHFNLPRELVFSYFIYFVLLRILLEQLDIPCRRGRCCFVSCALIWP